MCPVFGARDLSGRRVSLTGGAMGRAGVPQGVRRMRFEALLARHENGELSQAAAADCKERALSGAVSQLWQRFNKIPAVGGVVPDGVGEFRAGRRASAGAGRRARRDRGGGGAGGVFPVRGDGRRVALPPLPVADPRVLTGAVLGHQSHYFREIRETRVPCLGLVCSDRQSPAATGLATPAQSGSRSWPVLTQPQAAAGPVAEGVRAAPCGEMSA